MLKVILFLSVSLLNFSICCSQSKLIFIETLISHDIPANNDTINNYNNRMEGYYLIERNDSIFVIFNNYDSITMKTLYPSTYHLKKRAIFKIFGEITNLKK
jgi:hypothetical protein